MDHISAAVLLFVSFCQWFMADLADGLLSRMTLGTSIHVIFFPTILSGAVALLVKYLVAVRILPLCKLVSGSLLLLLVSWYIDRICKNNAFLLVRSVGLAIILCAVLGMVIVGEDGFASRHARVEAEAAIVSDYSAARD